MQARDNAGAGGAGLGFRGRLVAGTALATTVLFGGYGGRAALAGGCANSYSALGFVCTGAASPTGDDQRIEFTGPATVTTAAGFGIDSSNTTGDAIDLRNYSSGSITFTDDLHSAITGKTHGIYAYNEESGSTPVGNSISITTTGGVTGVTGDGIRVEPTMARIRKNHDQRRHP